MNTSQLSRPGALFAHLHETGHLICKLLQSGYYKREPQYCRNCLDFLCFKNCILTGDVKRDEVIVAERAQGMKRFKEPELKPESINELYNEQERLQEIFSDMLVCKLVFSFEPEKDLKNYFRYFVATYFLDPISTHFETELTNAQMFEAFFRGFLAIDPVLMNEERNRGGKLYKSKEYYEPDSRDCEAAWRRFVEFVEDAGPLFYDFRRLWKDGLIKNRESAKKQFIKAFRLSYQPMCCMYHDISRICESILLGKNTRSVAIDPPAGDVNEIVQEIAEAYKRGKPVHRLLYTDPRRKRHDRKYEPERYGHLDPFFLIRHLFRIHINTVFGRFDTKNKETCLLRDQYNEGTIKNGCNNNIQLLDRNYNGLFCADFTVRASYFRSRVMILKTFWDLSTNFRARAFKDLLHAAWPENTKRPA
ncbi:MAG: hypothetical protein GF350_07440 [Chitinivibrionales bacterium]|nr:hypothetical protein [Chitinivibrionales bacterium]